MLRLGMDSVSCISFLLGNDMISSASELIFTKLTFGRSNKGPIADVFYFKPASLIMTGLMYVTVA